MKKEIEAFVNAANEQELEAAWNNLSAEEQRVFEQLMEEDSPEDALAFFAQLYDDTPKEQSSETVSISENEIYFKRQPLTEEQKKHGSYVDEIGNLHVKNLSAPSSSNFCWAFLATMRSSFFKKDSLPS